MLERSKLGPIVMDTPELKGTAWRKVCFEQKVDRFTWAATVEVRIPEDTDSLAELERRAHKAALEFIHRIAATYKLG